MSAAFAPAPIGVHAPQSNSINEVLEYEKILKLRDEIFAGSHPRLTVPAHAIRKPSPRVYQGQHPPQTASQPTLPPKVPEIQLPGLQLTRNDAPSPPRVLQSIAFPATPSTIPVSQPVQSHSSGIDPVLLTKSDDLIRAETYLQRQRIEKVLKAQFEDKKAEARRRPAPQEAKLDYDLSAALGRALEIAKPESPAKPASLDDGASSSDSFDENSFYSSKAPDSTPEDGAHQRHSPLPKHQVQPMEVDDLDADGTTVRKDRRMEPFESAAKPYMVNGQSDIGTPSAIRPQYVPWQDRRSQQAMLNMGLTVLDDEDEPEYTPPEPTEAASIQANNGSYAYDNRAQAKRPLRRYSELDPTTARNGSPPDGDMRIVRNHITSPLAPQPSRVSPLAVAKAPPLSQNIRNRRDRNRQQQNGGPESPSSPEARAQPLHPRKKRKLDKRAEKRAQGRNRGSPSIKEEPVSPPPFHEKQPLGLLRPRQNEPIYIDDTPVQKVRPMPVSERYVEASPRRVVYDVEPPMPRSDPRPFSRSMGRPLGRDDQDLRKVASMHNMRAEAREYVEPVYETPSRTRAPSYAVVDRGQPIEDRRIHQEPYEERFVRSPAPQVYRDPETGFEYERQPMLPPPPPQRRIMIDEYGNEVVYQMVRSQRASLAPRPTPTSELEPYNDAAYARNRATSVFAEPQPEKRYSQEMPPPSVSYRRVAEPLRVSAVEAQRGTQDQVDPHRIQRSASVQIVDYPTRHPVYADERMDPREVRMSSVRAQAPRYEDMQPREGIQRVASVRPEAREGSVFVDDRRREYLPVEQPRFRTIVQDGRYFEVEDRDVTILDGAGDARQRLVQRY